MMLDTLCGLVSCLVMAAALSIVVLSETMVLPPKLMVVSSS